MPKQALVVGAGIAGMAAAIRLRCKGYAVSVFEANAYPGGKLSEIQLDAYRFDAGPSLFTLPQLVDELFELAGKDPSNAFRYKRKEIVCRYFFSDGTRFTAYANEARYIREASQVFDVQPEDLQSYLRACSNKHALTREVFMERSLHRLSTYLRWGTLKSLLGSARLGLFRTMHEENARHFKDPKLQQLFDRYATYNGSDPYQAPGVLTLIPHLEQHIGTFFPEGGMIRITEAIYELACELGVAFHFQSLVDEILTEKGRASGVRLGQAVHTGDVVVCNMDIVPAYLRLLPRVKPPHRILTQERSSSAIIFYWGIGKSFPELDLHNIFFSADYQQEFDAMFKQKTMPADPTIYLNISAKDQASDAPAGCENWFVMVNAPCNEGQDWDQLIAQTRHRVLQKLSAALGADIASLIQAESLLDPRSIESRTRSLQGSLYGTSSNSRLAAFLRHPNFAPSVRQLYFCGGSVHPGGGIPLCLLSARIATETIPSVT